MPSPSEAPAESAAAAATAAEVDAFMDQEMKKADEDAAAASTDAAKPTETTPEAKSSPAKPAAKPAVPAAVAALDKSLAPYLRSIQLKNQYIAVRVGYVACSSCTNAASAGGMRPPVTAVRNAIFFSWEDAKQFVEFEKQKADDAKKGDDKTIPFYSNVEWKAFDRLDKAEVRIVCFI